MIASAASADPLRWRTELQVSGFMFRVVRKDTLKTRNPEHVPWDIFISNGHEYCGLAMRCKAGRPIGN
jgi:hypothetical protein